MLLLADRIRKRLRRPTHALRQHRNLLTQLPVFRFQSGDSFLQDNHFVTLVGTIALLMPLYRYAVRPTFIGAVLNGRRYSSTIAPVLERDPHLEDRRGAQDAVH